MTTRSNFLRPLSLLPLILLFSSCSDNPIAPEGFIGHSGGCGNFMVYKFNVEKTDAVVVRGTDSGLDFNRNPTEYTLPDPRLTVSIERFSGPANAHYCDDVFDNSEPKLTETWKAVSGKVMIASGDTLQPVSGAPIYQIEVYLQDATFKSESGEEVKVENVDFGEITVGWYAG
ncbi:MAG: hypothetical protein KDD67_09835 [Ignavibacteriae bacterium]|nr:hypothetical protein [Ignavibacteriota bacterium]